MGNSNNSNFIEGKRIYLREVRILDVSEDYCQWMNDPDVIRYTESRFTPQSTEKIQAYVRRESENPDSVFMAIIEKEHDRHIGNIKIHRIDRYHLHAEVSIVIGKKECWGKGYGTEAIRLVVDFAFNTLNLRRLTAGVYANNIGSVRAFKKAGFCEEGLRKKHRFYKDAYVDEVLLGIARE